MWWEGLIGGLIIGLSTAFFLHTKGERTGISGIFSGVLMLEEHAYHWKGLWLSGLLLVSSVWSLLDDSYFISDGSVPENSIAGAFLGGFLVGIGTKLGNGCTSGHGVCGLGRMSKRSLAAVITFITSGFAMATTINNISSFLTTSDSTLRVEPLKEFTYAMLAAAIILGAVMLYKSVRKGEGWKKSIIPFIAGCIFVIGLIYGGMTRRSKVVGFLNGVNWDPQLIFVMGGAVLVSLPAFTYASKRDCTVLGCAYDSSCSTKITLQMIVGAWTFGLGWGLSGLCPGPALSQAAAGMPLTAALFLPGMAIGMMLVKGGKSYLEKLEETKEETKQNDNKTPLTEQPKVEA